MRLWVLGGRCSGRESSASVPLAAPTGDKRPWDADWRRWTQIRRRPRGIRKPGRQERRDEFLVRRARLNSLWAVSLPLSAQIRPIRVHPRPQSDRLFPFVICGRPESVGRRRFPPQIQDSRRLTDHDTSLRAGVPVPIRCRPVRRGGSLGHPCRICVQSPFVPFRS